LGYRLIDEAAVYGNEKECGEGIKRAIDEGIIKREDLFVTSKLWNTEHRKEFVEPACQRTLDDLGLDYVDLYLIHFPVSLKHIPFEHHYPPEWTDHPDGNNTLLIDLVPMHETWAAMEALQKKGKVKAIGISNMGTSLIRDIWSYAEIKPAVLQVELHPLNAQPKLVRFCHEMGMQVTGYSSLGAPAYIELGYSKKEEAAYDMPVVKDIAAAVGKSPCQVLLKWSLQR
jgi:diketogulonate reductase-like aldo/keto reductase